MRPLSHATVLASCWLGKPIVTRWRSCGSCGPIPIARRSLSQRVARVESKHRAANESFIGFDLNSSTERVGAAISCRSPGLPAPKASAASACQSSTHAPCVVARCDLRDRRRSARYQSYLHCSRGQHFQEQAGAREAKRSALDRQGPTLRGRSAIRPAESRTVAGSRGAGALVPQGRSHPNCGDRSPQADGGFNKRSLTRKRGVPLNAGLQSSIGSQKPVLSAGSVF